MARNTREPIFDPGEEIVLYSQGGFKNPMTSGWKLGHHYLTNRRLLFFQPSGIVYETPLENIINVMVEKQRFVLGRTKEVISLSYRHKKNGRRISAWIIMGDLETWRKKLSEMILIDERAVDKVAKELDLPCSEILRYLWEHRHAPIDELARLVDAPNHMDVLLKIRGVINPVAERVIGCPILEFERARIDDRTGEKVLFSWWLAGRKAAERKEEALVDIFDEGDRLNLILELRGVKEEDIKVRVERDRLIVSVEVPNKEYHEEIPLPEVVSSEGFTTRYNNNILEVTLQKGSRAKKEVRAEKG